MRSSEKNPKSDAAFRALIRLLYKRDHSIKELKTKLQRYYTTEAVDTALQRAEEQKWLKAPEELSRTLSESLHRRGKGVRALNRVLKDRGLPEVAKDSTREEEKARVLIERRFKDLSDIKARQKAYRLLANRGFDHDTIMLVLKNPIEVGS